MKTLAIHVANEQEFNELMKIYKEKGFRRCSISVMPNPWETFNKRMPFIEYGDAFVAYSDSKYLEVISFQEFLTREGLSEQIEIDPVLAKKVRKAVCPTLEEVLERMPAGIELIKDGKNKWTAIGPKFEAEHYKTPLRALLALEAKLSNQK